MKKAPEEKAKEAKDKLWASIVTETENEVDEESSSDDEDLEKRFETQSDED